MLNPYRAPVPVMQPQGSGFSQFAAQRGAAQSQRRTINRQARMQRERELIAAQLAMRDQARADALANQQIAESNQRLTQNSFFSNQNQHARQQANRAFNYMQQQDTLNRQDRLAQQQAQNQLAQQQLGVQAQGQQLQADASMYATDVGYWAGVDQAEATARGFERSKTLEGYSALGQQQMRTAGDIRRAMIEDNYNREALQQQMRLAQLQDATSRRGQDLARDTAKYQMDATIDRANVEGQYGLHQAQLGAQTQLTLEQQKAAAAENLLQMGFDNEEYRMDLGRRMLEAMRTGEQIAAQRGMNETEKQALMQTLQDEAILQVNPAMERVIAQRQQQQYEQEQLANQTQQPAYQQLPDGGMLVSKDWNYNAPVSQQQSYTDSPDYYNDEFGRKVSLQRQELKGSRDLKILELIAKPETPSDVRQLLMQQLGGSGGQQPQQADNVNTGNQMGMSQLDAMYQQYQIPQLQNDIMSVMQSDPESIPAAQALADEMQQALNTPDEYYGNKTRDPAQVYEEYIPKIAEFLRSRGVAGPDGKVTEQQIIAFYTMLFDGQQTKGE